MRTLSALLISMMAIGCTGGWTAEDEHPGNPTPGTGGGSSSSSQTGGHDEIPLEPTCTPGVTRDCYGGPGKTAGIGACKSGTQTCSEDGTAWGLCTGEIWPATELCQTPEDDDCDGAANEDCACVPDAVESCYTGPAGTEATGICHSGSQTCSRDGTAWGPCDGEQTPGDELCQTPEDDDCDGTANEDCICSPGAVLSCYTGPAGTDGIGICKRGVSVCAWDGKSWLPCFGETTPQPAELCETPEDDDCDGATDDDNSGCPENTTCQDHQCISQCLAHGILDCPSNVCMLKFICGSQGGPLECGYVWACVP